MRDSDKANKFAGRYNFLWPAPGEEVAACAELLKVGPRDRVIEFGCGGGEFLAAALTAGAEGVTGVDASVNKLEQAKLRLKGDARAELIKSSPLDFDPVTKTFTKGIARNVLRLFPEKDKKRFFSRISSAFGHCALFLIEDIVFDFEHSELDMHWPELMKDCAAHYGAAWDRRKGEMTYRFKKEFPEGIKTWTAAAKTGSFRLLRRVRKNSFHSLLLSEKS